MTEITTDERARAAEALAWPAIKNNLVELGQRCIDTRNTFEAEQNRLNHIEASLKYGLGYTVKQRLYKLPYGKFLSVSLEYGIQIITPEPA